MNRNVDELQRSAHQLAIIGKEMYDALQSVDELIDGYVDVTDGVKDGHTFPMPNKAMRARQIIEEVTARAKDLF